MVLDAAFTGQVGIIQRVLPTYRRPFFERLGATPGVSLSVFAGQPLPGAATETVDGLGTTHMWKARNQYVRLPGGYICWQSGILSWLRQFDPDVLIVEANPRLLGTWLAIRWMKRRRRPVLGWGLGELPRSGAHWLRRVRAVLAKNLIRSLDGMIAYGSKASQYYVKVGVRENRVFTAYNAIDDQESECYLVRIGRDPTWLLPWKKSLELDPQLPIILSVGRLSPQKRVDLLIEACGPILDRCQLLVVGDGPSRAELEAQVSPYGNGVRFIGHQSGEMLARCFMASDIFVLPGAGGLAVHQAMSFGKPVIVGVGDGTESDLVRDGVNGLFVVPNDVVELRQGITNLIARADLRQSMGNASLSIVRTEVNMGTMVASFNQAIAAVTCGTPKAHV